jgi:hypothetical protein
VTYREPFDSGVVDHVCARWTGLLEEEVGAADA